MSNLHSITFWYSLLIREERIMKKLLTFSLIFFVQFSHAAEWLHIFNTETEEYYVDIESVKNVNSYNKDLVKAWFKLDIFKDIAKDGMGVGDKTMVLYQIDCKSKKMGLLQGIRYKKGKPFGATLNMPNPNMKDVIPDSNGEDMLNRACSIYEIQNGTRS